MVRNWKTVSVGASLALGVLALGAYAYTRARVAPTYRLANGVEVTPVDVPPDDVARVLDVKVWKFDVTLPDAKQGLQLSLDSCGYGKKNHGLGGVGFLPMKGSSLERQFLVTVILAPEGEDLARGGHIKYLLESPQGAGSGRFTNPLQGCDGIGYGPDVSETESRVYLVGGGKTGSSSLRDSDKAIALTITPTKPL